MLSNLKKYSKSKFRLSDESDQNYPVQSGLERSKNNILNEVGVEVYDFIEEHMDLSEIKTFTTETSTIFNISNLSSDDYSQIINLKKINDARFVNKFLEAVNSKLDYNGLYFSSVETFAHRRKRIIKKYLFPYNYAHYFADVVFMRVFPKLLLTKKLYFFITHGKNRVLTRAETFGRLYSCGFEIVTEQTINNKLYFVARKIKQPYFDTNPSYGLLISLKRIGKDGKLIKVYKLRTMHAYAEYLQEYVHDQNSLKEGGKFNNDFRITPEGKIFRKFWLDELPMLINLLKGDMKLVGVRPLSEHYFSLYSEELQLKRIKTKPGLIPPFYVDMPKTIGAIMESEMRYLEAYEKEPFRTDIRYFFKAFYNIFFEGARST